VSRTRSCSVAGGGVAEGRLQGGSALVGASEAGKVGLADHHQTACRQFGYAGRMFPGQSAGRNEVYGERMIFIRCRGSGRSGSSIANS